MNAVRRPPPSDSPAYCAGDCDLDGEVAINELVAGVNLAFEIEMSACDAAYCNADCAPGPARRRASMLGCLVRAVNNALEGCIARPCADDSECDDANACTSDQCTARGCSQQCECF